MYMATEEKAIRAWLKLQADSNGKIMASGKWEASKCYQRAGRKHWKQRWVICLSLTKVLTAMDQEDENKTSIWKRWRIRWWWSLRSIKASRVRVMLGLSVVAQQWWKKDLTLQNYTGEFWNYFPLFFFKNCHLSVSRALIFLWKLEPDVQTDLFHFMVIPALPLIISF